MNPRWIMVIALWAIVGLTEIAGWTALARSGEMFANTSSGQTIFIAMTGLAAPALSTVMLRRHPDEWTGPLLGVCVVAAMLGFARLGRVGAFSQLAGIVALVTVLLPAVVALNYPAFGCPTAWLRRLTWCWWATAAAGATVGVLGVAGGSVPGHWWYTADPGAAGTAPLLLLLLYSMIVLAGLTVTVIAAVSRYRSMPGGGRAVLRPMVVPLLGWATATAAETGWTVVGTVTEPEVKVGPQPSLDFYTMLPTLLVAILAAGIWWIDTTVRQPSRPVGGDRWAHRLRRYGRETAVEQYLSRALADPSIRVLYPVPAAADRGEQDWVDSHGRPATPDDAAPDRSVTIIRRGDTVIGLIEQDAAATARPDAVELVATGAGLIMETERLTATARSDLDRSRQLASRLLSASDEPRAELRSALLDGPLGDLAGVAADLESGQPLADVVPRLTAAAAQVRALSHGVFPPVLTAGGLRAALPWAAVPARRYPAVVEMTAYLAAHPDRSAAVAEAVLDDGPALQIQTVLHPSGAVRDRVTALGGRVDTTGAGWQLTVPADG